MVDFCGGFYCGVICVEGLNEYIFLMFNCCCFVIVVVIFVLNDNKFIVIRGCDMGFCIEVVVNIVVVVGMINVIKFDDRIMCWFIYVIGLNFDLIVVSVGVYWCFV